MKKIDVLNMIANGGAVGYVFNGMEFTSDINPLQFGSMVDTLNDEGYEPILKEKNDTELSDKVKEKVAELNAALHDAHNNRIAVDITIDGIVAIQDEYPMLILRCTTSKIL